jgi:phenylacetate-CoA ligase
MLLRPGARIDSRSVAALYRPEIQTLPRDRLRALQEERLRALAARAFEVPFFRRLLQGAGLAPDDLKTLDDLRRVPRITKQDLRASEEAHPPLGDYRGAPLERCVRLSTSTGTTGRPTIILLTPHDLAVEHDAACRMFARQGYRPGEIVTHAHPGGLNGGQALLGGALEAFGCLNVPVGPPTTRADAERAIALWRELRPHRYEMFGPALHTFWETAREMGLDPERDLGMPPPVELPPWRTASAGLECFAFLGSACAEARGAHVCEDEAIVEAVDPATGEPVPDGVRGHLVVTSLTKDNFLLRYDLEDLVRLDRSPCPCGETHLRLFWDGRAKDLVRAGDRELLPIDVWLVLREVDEVARPAVEYQLVRTADASTLRVRVEAATPGPALERRLAGLLEERLGVPARVETLPQGALPRPAYKPVPVVDE